MANDNIVLFKDLMNQAKTIKYVYKYGFSWKNELSQEIFHITCRDMERMSHVIYKKTDREQYGKYVYEITETGRKSDRILMNRLRYRKEFPEWIFSVLRLYGAVSMTEQQKQRIMKQVACDMMEDNRENRLHCDFSGCCYARICKVLQKIDMVSEAFENNQPEFLDVIGMKRFFVKMGILKNQRKGYQFRPYLWKLQEQERKHLIQMLCFFSVTLPLGSLGYLLAKKLGNIEDLKAFLMVHGFMADMVLQQEAIYSCLKIMYDKKMICFGNQKKEYLPLKIIYKGSSVIEEREYPYLLAYEEETEQYLEIPLYQCCPIRAGKCQKKEREPKERTIEKKCKEISVEFYYNDAELYGKITEFVLKRADSMWEKERMSVEILPERVKKTSVYYPQNIWWKVCRCGYSIQEEQEDDFYHWLVSFGEFAAVKKWKGEKIFEEKPDKSKIFEMDGQGRIKEQLPEYTLCNLYHSEILSKEMKIKNGILPTGEEIEWLLFVLEEYDIVAHFFLSEEEYQHIKKIAKQEKEFYGECFSPYKDLGILWENKAEKMKKVSSALIEKYNLIKQAILEKKMFRYFDRTERGMEIRDILPYTLEYNNVKYKNSKSMELFYIMAYDLKQKRTVRIEGKRVKVHQGAKEAEFSVWDRLYHILSFFIRCGSLKVIRMKEVIEEMHRSMFSEKLDINWHQKYFGAVKLKHIVEKYDFCELYDQMYQEIAVWKEDELSDFVENVFRYYRDILWKNGGEISENQRAEKLHGVRVVGKREEEYQTILLYYFWKIAQKLYGERKKKNLEEKLMEFPKKDLLEMILGKPEYLILEKESIETAVSEVEFYNECLKCIFVEFDWNGRINEHTADGVCSLFREFNCTGEWKKHKIHFTVEYDRFHYRKIQMCLLSIYDRIEHIYPKEIANILEKRYQGWKDGKNLYGEKAGANHTGVYF